MRGPQRSRALAAELALDGEQRRPAARGGRARSRGRRRRSGTAAGRRRRPDRSRAAPRRATTPGSSVERRADRRLAVAEVGADPDVRAGHRSTVTVAPAAVELELGLADADARARAGNRRISSSATAAASVSSSWNARAVRDLAHAGDDVAVVHRVARCRPRRARPPRARRRRRKRWPSRRSSLEHAVPAAELDPLISSPHTAPAAASASTCSRTSWTRKIDAPRS